MQPHQRIILTGASSGIGRMLAMEYAARGARLVLVARRAELLETLVDDVTRSGGKAVAVAGDVADPGLAAQALAAACDAFGGVDVVVMNAGRGGPMFVDAFDVEEGIRVTEVNYLAVLRMLGVMLPAMRAAGRGTIVAISSLAAFRGMPGSGAYNASKAAVNVLMESVRTELRGSGIDIVTIAPGFVRTDMTAVNEFHMPFLMDAGRAARKIIRAIDRGRSLYRFPIGTSIAVRILQMLPNAIYDRLMRWGRRAGARTTGESRGPG